MRYEDITSVDLFKDTPRYEATKGNVTAVYTIGVYTEDYLIIADAVYSFTVEELEEDGSGTHNDLSSVEFTVENPLLVSADELTDEVDRLTENVEEFINSNGIKTTRGETDKDFFETVLFGALDYLSHSYIY